MKECTVFVSDDITNPIAAGKFALDQHGQGHFIYGKKFLSSEDRGFSFDPINLPLLSAQQHIAVHPDGSFGVLSDAGPNTWGRRVTSRICKNNNAYVPSNPVEWLLSSYHYGAGCFAFSPAPDVPPAPTIEPLPLSELNAKFLSAIDHLDEEKDPHVLQLILPGASLGGARPKTVVMHDGEEYIAKFNKKDDLFDVSTVEYASLRLAHNAQINVPDFELVEVGGRPTFLVKRFDRREGGGRIHYISAHSLLNLGVLAGDGHELKTKYSYGGIAEISRSFNPEAVADARQLFRRMVFNILIGNMDDHMRNHGFLMQEAKGAYRLSPAFDVLPHLEAPYMPQSIGVGAHGAASTILNAMTQCGRFFLEPAAAQEIVNEVRDVAGKWRAIFHESDVSASDIHLLAPCFSATDSAERVVISTYVPDK